MTTLIPKFDLKNGGSTPAGAINRTIYQKLSDTISVKDFGAVGNGSTDDTAAILAACASLTSNSSLYFPAGNYLFNNGATGFTLTGLNNVYIRGEGAQITLSVNAGMGRFVNCVNINVTGLKILGTWGTAPLPDFFTGNENQGRFSVSNCNTINFYENFWQNCTQALTSFTDDLNTNINFYNNHCDAVFAPVQLAGGLTGVNISDNYFYGFISTTTWGSDDIIAIFSGTTTEASAIIISRNFIDKQGPTVWNQAHGILVSWGSTSHFLTEITISDNIIYNTQSLTGASARPAIAIGGATVDSEVYRCNISGNLISNTNLPIFVDVLCLQVNIENNQIRNSFSLAGTTGFTAGQGITIKNNGLTYAQALIATGNNLTQCQDRGLNVSACKQAIISSNMIIGSTSFGITIDQVDQLVINGNVCANNSVGAYVNTSSNMSIVGNTFTNNSTYGLQITGTGASGTVSSNTMLGNTTANYSNTASGSTIVLTGNSV